MTDEQIARPYGKAAFELAEEAGQTETVIRELGHVLEVWREAPELRAFWLRPEVSPAAKIEALHRIFDQDLGPLTRRLLEVIVKKGRIAALPAIFQELLRLFDQARGIVQVEVESASGLSSQETQALQGALQRATGHRVQLHMRTNRELLGGLVVRIGDRVLDGSLARRLAILGERLRSGDRGGNVVEY